VHLQLSLYLSSGVIWRQWHQTQGPGPGRSRHLSTVTASSSSDPVDSAHFRVTNSITTFPKPNTGKSLNDSDWIPRKHHTHIAPPRVWHLFQGKCSTPVAQPRHSLAAWVMVPVKFSAAWPCVTTSSTNCPLLYHINADLLLNKLWLGFALLSSKRLKLPLVWPWLWQAWSTHLSVEQNTKVCWWLIKLDTI
jgi:hypothetical protein